MALWTSHVQSSVPTDWETPPSEWIAIQWLRVEKTNPNTTHWVAIQSRDSFIQRSLQEEKYRKKNRGNSRRNVPKF